MKVMLKHGQQHWRWRPNSNSSSSKAMEVERMAGNRVRWRASVKIVMAIVICLHDRNLVLLILLILLIWLVWLMWLVWLYGCMVVLLVWY